MASLRLSVRNFIDVLSPRQFVSQLLRPTSLKPYEPFNFSVQLSYAHAAPMRLDHVTSGPHKPGKLQSRCQQLNNSIAFEVQDMTTGCNSTKMYRYRDKYNYRSHSILCQVGINTIWISCVFVCACVCVCACVWRQKER